MALRQRQSEGFRQGLQTGQELLTFRFRPFRLRQPQQQLLLIRRLRRVLHRMAVQAQVSQFPNERLLQLRRTRHRQTPPHQRLTGWASWMPSIAVIVCNNAAGIGSSMLSTITASPRTILRPTCIAAMFTLCSPSIDPS